MAEPLYIRRPNQVERLVSKYSTLGPQLRQLNPSVYQPLVRFDAERVERGRDPLSDRETGLALQALITEQAHTPAAEQSPWEAVLGSLNPFKGRDNPIIRDITTIGSAIPRIPGALIEEARSLPQLPQNIAAATAEGGNIFEDVGNIAALPGVRMIPGSYVAQNLLGGQDVTLPANQQVEGSPGELARHPLFTGLDVLPYASGAAARTPLVRAAREAETAQAAIRGAATEGVLGVPRPVRPLRTVLTRRLDDAGMVEPNVVGRATGAAYDAFARTRPGQLYESALGRQGRELSRVRNVLTRRHVTEPFDPTGRAFPDDELVGLAREVQQLPGQFDDITPDRIVDITSRLEHGDDLSGLLGREAELVNRVRPLTERFRQVGEEQGFLGKFDDETYLLPEAQRLTGLQRTRDITAEINGLRRLAADPGDFDPTSILDDLDAPLTRTDITKNTQSDLLEARAQALRSMGYEANDLLSTIGGWRVNQPGMDEAAILAQIDNLRGSTPRPNVDVEGVVAQLKSTFPKDVVVDRLAQSIKAGRWTGKGGASEALRSLRKRTTWNRIEDILDDVDGLKDTVTRRGQRDRYISKTESLYGDTRVNRTARAFEQYTERTPPARYVPLVQRKVREGVKELAEERVRDGVIDPTKYTLDDIFQLADEGQFQLIPGIEQGEYRAIQREAAATWREMRASGQDPMFVHRVSPHGVRAMRNPIVLERVRTPSQVRTRTLDAAPYAQDVTLALNHQALEWLSKRGDEAFVEGVGQMWGRRGVDLQQDFLDQARRIADNDPSVTTAQALDQLIKKEWTQYRPQEIFNFPSNRWQQFTDEDMWVPRGVADNIQRMHHPSQGRLTGLVDPVMGLFRVSVLALSPRWHLYNILGGATMLMARTEGPTVLRYFDRARKALNERELPLELGHGAGTGADLMRQWDQQAARYVKAPLNRKLEAMTHYLGGKTARRILEAGGKGIEASYKFNQMVDDMYRSMAYLSGSDRALAKGLTKEQAQQEGISLGRSILQDWDALTPIERSTMRYVFPFYGWMNHILRYTMAYPFDHPVRTAVAAQFARNEVEDLGTGLPLDYLNYFFLGEPDANGDVNAIQTRGMNPFADVANYFTMEGFLGSVNPFVSAIATSLGIDVLAGGPELYPELRYDPESGNLVAATGNPLTNIVQATIPQTRAIGGLLGWNQEYRSMLRNDPSAAHRALLSQVGIPSAVRTEATGGRLRLGEERIETELARSEAMGEAFNAAVRTGSDRSARRYPVLGAYLDQIRQMQREGQLADYEVAS